MLIRVHSRSFAAITQCSGRACSRLRARLRFIFRSALGLDLLGLEDAVASQSAVSQALGALLESIGQRVAARVDDFQFLAFLQQYKLDAIDGFDDRARLDVAGHPQP